MNKLLIMILSLGIICLGACVSPETQTQTLRYTYDSNTNLCFASLHLGYQNGVLTNVPCTPEVLREIEHNR